MKIISDINEMKNYSAGLKKEGGLISFVPTMGKLHDGHVSLINEGKKHGVVIVSIFVNPLQFGKNEDFERYPSDFEGDKIKLEQSGVSCLFYPTVDIIKDTQTFIVNPSLSDKLCGISRKGHFQGVLTIVMKLFSIVSPDFAIFGLKDYQQFVMVKKMAQDYFLDIKIIPVRTIRNKTGLAISSRNTYFAETDKEYAKNFYKSLKETASIFESGEKDCEKLSVYCIKNLINFGFEIEYVKIMDNELKAEKLNADNGDILLAAVRFKGVRLIDNIFFE